MITATSSLRPSSATDPLDFSLADRLPARDAGHGRLLIGAAPQDRRPGLLFVPGAYHGAWCYAHYLDYFANAGLACAALDMRGHGSLPQDASFSSVTIADLGEDVANALDALEGPTIVVGHSMGALPALLAASHRPVAGVVLMAPSPPGDLPGALALPPVPGGAPRTPPSATEIRARFLATTPERDVREVTRRLCAESPQVLNDRYLLRVAVAAASVTAPGLCLEAGLDTHDRHPPGQDQAIARRYGFSHAVLAGQPHCMMYADHWQISAAAILDWHRGRFG
ncbi:alpha/beta hydrolase [Achromobacter deleyi]|uniref:alpha/beta hydrolase n=1 Tax=Achromobacter deleyi TaxID=1353891 RepID=UPI0014911833|nr:alpha/beta hydrolase [Achromobacter deleyi]QVQ24927.1 alpha/beta hydrolase [Achromobacter deleyi]UIP20465.1 alpha/beta hydrolase [Achromobacter deleyi]